MDDEYIETRLTRLMAFSCAIEDVLVEVVNALPNRKEILAKVSKEGAGFDDVALGESFSEEELAAFQEARERLLALLATKR